MIYPFWETIVRPVYLLWTRNIRGLENLPRDRPFIVAANHSSYYDTLLVPIILIPFLGKKATALVSSKYWKIPIANYVLTHGECIPVYIGNDKDAKSKNNESLAKAARYLKKGNIIFMFPEGTRSYDGKLKKAHTGVARLALEAGMPVVPFGIIDSHRVMPKGKIFPRLKRCEVKIGKPMYFKKYYNKKINDRVLENTTRDVMKQIGKLIGQKYDY
ncbi:MAG TPA: lysophospholipid acyltransferase family protein [Candidatus Nanoarchaeia archaeon]|nr:lysophospholipid acyltransferase family protein [Candidatus Nanoarchaeia archaeon]